MRSLEPRNNRLDRKRYTRSIALAATLHASGIAALGISQEGIDKTFDQAYATSEQVRRSFIGLFSGEDREAYKESIRNGSRPELGDFYLKMEKLEGAIDDETQKEAEKVLDRKIEEFQKLAENQEDPIKVLQAITDYAHRKEGDDTKSYLSNLILEGDGNCESRQKLNAAIVEKVFPNLKIKVQTVKKDGVLHTRALVEVDGKWRSMEENISKPMSEEDFEGAVLYEKEYDIKEYIGEGGKVEYITSDEEIDSRNRRTVTDSLLKRELPVDSDQIRNLNEASEAPEEVQIATLSQVDWDAPEYIKYQREEVIEKRLKASFESGSATDALIIALRSEDYFKPDSRRDKDENLWNLLDGETKTRYEKHAKDANGSNTHSSNQRDLLLVDAYLEDKSFEESMKLLIEGGEPMHAFYYLERNKSELSEEDYEKVLKRIRESNPVVKQFYEKLVYERKNINENRGGGIILLAPMTEADLMEQTMWRLAERGKIRLTETGRENVISEDKDRFESFLKRGVPTIAYDILRSKKVHFTPSDYDKQLKRIINNSSNLKAQTNKWLKVGSGSLDLEAALLMALLTDSRYRYGRNKNDDPEAAKFLEQFAIAFSANDPKKAYQSIIEGEKKIHPGTYYYIERILANIDPKSFMEFHDLYRKLLAEEKIKDDAKVYSLALKLYFGDQEKESYAYDAAGY